MGDEFDLAPIGAGPFRFKKWDKDSETIVLEANPDYYDGRPPGIDEIHVRTIREERVRLEEYRNNKLELFYLPNRGILDVIQTEYPELLTQVVHANTATMMYLGLNTAPTWKRLVGSEELRNPLGSR